MKLFFNEILDSIEIKQNLASSNIQIISDKYIKMKLFIEKASNEFKQSINEDNQYLQQISQKNIPPATNKKDIIFYHLLNNFSHTINQSNIKVT